MVDRLSLHTSLGTPETVLALERHPAGWVRVRLPGEPPGTTGWVRQRHLGRLRRVATSFVVDRDALCATLFERGRAVWSGPVGIGKDSWPTPPGRFYVRQRVVPESPRGLYGVFAFGISARVAEPPWAGGDFIAIHGTSRPEIVPGRVSKGCIRVRNEDVLRLRELMPLGTPVEIL